MKFLDQLSEEDIINLLRIDLSIENPGYPVTISLGVKLAAVLIPLLRFRNVKGEFQWHILLTHRTDRVADHKNQVSFPGGQADSEDIAPENTALREAYEEIGIKPEDVRLAGRLEPLLTISNYLVTPVVGFIPYPYPFRLQHEEVSRIFTIPLSWLADSRNHEIREREWKDQSGKAHSHPVIFFSPYDGETLWGVSAEITLRFLDKLKKALKKIEP